MITKGADPAQCADDEDDDEDGFSYRCWKGYNEEDKEESQLTVYNQGHSAISLAMEWKKQFVGHPKWDEEDVERLDRLLDVFTALPLDPRKMVSVDESVLQLWESIHAQESSHDVAFICKDLISVGAHSIVLASASPVLLAMLSSDFREGVQRKVELADTPEPSVRLFLELVYTGGSATEICVPVALSALDLAHRWEVSGVVGMLERALVPLIARTNFAQIAEAAVIRSLPVLSSGCVGFAQKRPSVIDALDKAHELSAAVLALVGGPVAVDGQPRPAKKQRRSF